LTRLAANLVPAPGVAGVNADPDDIAGRDRVDIKRVQRLIHDSRIAPARPGRRRQDVEPARGNHRHAEGFCARIDEMNA
jgi:hypothetical protein